LELPEERFGNVASSSQIRSHDREVSYGFDFGARLARLGVTQVRTPVRALRANSIAERLVRTVRNECLDHVIVGNERHLSVAACRQ
jgi:putative transposase